MKLIPIVRRILDESKQVGIIYHYTKYISAIDIIKDNRLNGSFVPKETHSKYNFGVSFTRNKNLHIKTRIISGTDVRFVVDGDKLSNHYKIYPMTDGYGDEDETFVIVKEPKAIIDFLQYVISIDISNNNWRDFEDYCGGFNGDWGDFTDFKTFIQYIEKISNKKVMVFH